MLVGKLDAVLVDKLRSNVVGALIPIIDVMSQLLVLQRSSMTLPHFPGYAKQILS